MARWVRTSDLAATPVAPVFVDVLTEHQPEGMAHLVHRLGGMPDDSLIGRERWEVAFVADKTCFNSERNRNGEVRLYERQVFVYPC